MNEIEQKLRTLSTWYYVLAVLCIPSAFVAPLMIMLTSQSSDDEAKAMFIFMSISGLIGSLMIASLIGAVGYGLRKQRWWTFCFVISILMCPSFPFGTILGVFTLITLNKPEAKKLFTPNQGMDPTLKTAQNEVNV